MNYEKNIPTEQDQKKAFPRVPSKNGNQGWSQSSSQKKTEGSSPVNCITFSFKKSMHVRKKWEFNKIRKSGTKFYGKHACFQYTIDTTKYSKLGLTVSKKYGNAVKRNLFKRRMRELFRHKCIDFPNSISVNILPLRGSNTATFANLEDDWNNFLTYLNKSNTDDQTT